jgi:hypothetical protein
MLKGMDELTIQEIARQSQITEAEVRQVYALHLQALRVGARIHDFLPLLAMKQVRQHFVQRNARRLAGGSLPVKAEVLRRRV